MVIKKSSTKVVKKSTKLPNTPRSRVKNVLRQLWMRSRERAAALKRTNRCCTICSVKATQAKGKEQKMEVHHNHPPRWDKIIDMIFEEILCDPSLLTPLCPKCHDKEDGPGHDRGHNNLYPIKEIKQIEEVIWE